MPEEQELRVYFNGFASDNTKGLLAVRLAASGAWVGQEVDFLSRATFGPFVGFEPLEYKTSHFTEQKSEAFNKGWEA